MYADGQFVVREPVVAQHQDNFDINQKGNERTSEKDNETSQYKRTRVGEEVKARAPLVTRPHHHLSSPQHVGQTLHVVRVSVSSAATTILLCWLHRDAE